MSGARKTAISAAAPAPSKRSPMRTSSLEMVTSGLSFATVPPADWARATPTESVSQAAMIARRRIGLSSGVHVVVGLQHLVGRLDHLGVHLVGALRGDQAGHLEHGVDVRLFEIALLQVAKTVLVGIAVL